MINNNTNNRYVNKKTNVFIVDSFKSVIEYFNENTFIITAYDSMKEEVKRVLKNSPVVSMVDVQKALMGELDTRKADNLRIKLDIIEKLKNSEDNLSIRYSKDPDKIIRGVKLLTELRVIPEEYYKFQTTKDELGMRNFHEIIVCYENFFDYIVKQYNYINLSNGEKDSFYNNFTNNFDVLFKSKDGIKKRKIILYGFNIKTPPQQFIFDMAEKAGFELNFIVNGDVDDNFQNLDINRSIIETFKDKKIGILGNKTPISPAKLVSLILEGRENELTEKDKISLREKFKFIEYENEVGFYKDLSKSIGYHKSQNERAYFSANHKQTVKMLMHCNNSMSGKKFLIKTYSLGIALYELYKLYDSKFKDVIFTDKSIKIIFESGIIIDREKNNAKNFIGIYEEIYPYFASYDVLKATEWIKACEDLIRLKKDSQIRDYIAGLGPFDINLEDIRKIKGFFEIINALVRRLFFDNKEKSLVGYFEVLKQVLKEEETNIDDGYESIQTYKSLLGEIDNIISNINKEAEYRNYKVAFENVATCIKEFIGVIDDEPSEEELENFKMVRKLDDCEFTTFRDLKTVYILELTRDTFGATKGDYEYPLLKHHIVRLRDELVATSGDKYAINNINASLNILETSTDVANHSLFMALKNNCNIVFVRVKAKNGEDNSHYIEKKIREVLKLDVIENKFITGSYGKGNPYYKITEDDKRDIEDIIKEVALKTNAPEEDIKEYFDLLHKDCPYRYAYALIKYERIIDKLLYTRSFPNIIAYGVKKRKLKRIDDNKLTRLAVNVTNERNTSTIKENKRVSFYTIREANKNKIKLKYIAILMDEKEHDDICQNFRDKQREIVKKELGISKFDTTLNEAEKQMIEKALNRRLFGEIKPMAIKNSKLCASCPRCHKCLERTFERNRW